MITGMSITAAAGRRIRSGLILIALPLASFCLCRVAAASETARPRAVPTAFELQRMYADRTWNWKDGAAFFAKDRTMRAFVGTGDATSIGEGRWLVTDAGKMCMELAWRGKTYSEKPKRTCFSHRIEGGVVEQRKDPDGTWYSFMHSPEETSDEHKKFEEGDAKGAQFEAARKLIDTKS